MKRPLLELTLPGSEKVFILLDFLRKKWFFVGPPLGKTVWNNKVTQALEGAMERDSSKRHKDSFKLLDTNNKRFTTLDLHDIYEKTAIIVGGKSGKMHWSDSLAHNRPLSQLRRTAQKVLSDLIPRAGLSFTQMTDGSEEKVGGNPKKKERYNLFVGQVGNKIGTNCVDFPKVYMYHLSKALFGKGEMFRHAWEFIRRGTSLPGRKRCAVMRNSPPWPLPGDIFVICAGPNLSGEKGHVGVIYEINDPKDVSALIWTTVDLGQSGGHGAAWVRRTYNPKDGTLSGDAINPRKPRALMEWLDIEEYYGRK